MKLKRPERPNAKAVMSMCVHVCVCVCACVRACVHACVCMPNMFGMDTLIEDVSVRTLVLGHVYLSCIIL